MVQLLLGDFGRGFGGCIGRSIERFYGPGGFGKESFEVI